MTENVSDDGQLKLTPMPPREFKGVIAAKGWQIKELAERWQLSRVRISQICSDESRPLYYDDAVRALPVRDKR